MRDHCFAACSPRLLHFTPRCLQFSSRKDSVFSPSPTGEHYTGIWLLDGELQLSGLYLYHSGRRSGQAGDLLRSSRLLGSLLRVLQVRTTLNFVYPAGAASLGKASTILFLCAAVHLGFCSCSNDEPVGGFEVPGQVRVPSGGVDCCRAGRQNRGCCSGD